MNAFSRFINSNPILAGFFLGFIVFFVDLFFINLLFAKEGSFSFFLSSAWQLKTLVGWGSLASIPIVALFAYFLQQKQMKVAQGLQYFLILVVVVLAYLRFVVS